MKGLRSWILFGDFKVYIVSQQFSGGFPNKGIAWTGETHGQQKSCQSEI